MIERFLTKRTNLVLRVIACVVDYGFVLAFFAITTLIFGEYDGRGTIELNGLPKLIPVLFWFILTVFMELYLGATIGNTLMGLRPIPAKCLSKVPPEKLINEKIPFAQSLTRHLFDIVDMIWIGFFLILFTERKQRLGDIAAGTVVVRVANLKQFANQ